MAYSPRTGFLYVPVNEICNDITPNDHRADRGQELHERRFPLQLPPGRTTYSHVDAWDPVTGKRAWSMPYKYVLLSSMLATAGDLVFTGDPEGDFFALDAKSGNKLWSFKPAPAIAARRFRIRSTAASTSRRPRDGIRLSSAVQSARLFPDEDFRLGSTLVVFALPEGSR